MTRDQEKIKLLVRLAEHAKTVPLMNQTMGIAFVEDDCPACLITEGVRAGILSPATNGLEYAEGFGEYFELEEWDACDALFFNCKGGVDRAVGECAGDEWHAAIVRLFQRNGLDYYAELAKL